MKKNIKLLLFIFSLAVTFSYVSCTDENKFTNPVTYGLENGAFAVFETSPPEAAYPDPLQINFSDMVTDPNKTIIAYNVTLVASLSGNETVVEDFFVATSFPANMSFNSESLSSAMGLEPSDINFGDTFNFIATATREDGTVFTGTAPTFNSTTLEVGGGNTEPTLQVSTYKSAMQWGFIIACPFDQAAMLGTYTIEDGSLHAANGSGIGQTFEVVAGASANEIILKNPFGSVGAYDVVLTVSEFGLVSYDWQNFVNTEEVCCAGYTPTQMRSNPGATSLALSCIGLIDLKFNTRLGVQGGSPSGFTFGDRFQIARKN